MREYEPGDRVKIRVHSGAFWTTKECEVDSYQDNNGSWQYRLKDLLTGQLVENGKWFGETELSAA